MKANLLLYLLIPFALGLAHTVHAATPNPKKMKFLVHVTTGSENPTKAALAFLVAKTAVEEGQDVTLFLAGDAVLLMRDEVMKGVTGLGTGSLNDHFQVIAKSSTRIFLSGNSCKARGLTLEELKGKPVTMALPNVLVNLAAESDRMFTY